MPAHRTYLSTCHRCLLHFGVSRVHTGCELQSAIGGENFLWGFVDACTSSFSSTSSSSCSACYLIRALTHRHQPRSRFIKPPPPLWLHDIIARFIVVYTSQQGVAICPIALRRWEQRWEGLIIGKEGRKGGFLASEMISLQWRCEEGLLWFECLIEQVSILNILFDHFMAFFSFEILRFKERWNCERREKIELFRLWSNLSILNILIILWLFFSFGILRSK